MKVCLHVNSSFLSYPNAEQYTEKTNKKNKNTKEKKTEFNIYLAWSDPRRRSSVSIWGVGDNSTVLEGKRVPLRGHVMTMIKKKSRYVWRSLPQQELFRKALNSAKITLYSNGFGAKRLPSYQVPICASLEVSNSRQTFTRWSWYQWVSKNVHLTIWIHFVLGGDPLGPVRRLPDCIRGSVYTCLPNKMMYPLRHHYHWCRNYPRGLFQKRQRCLRAINKTPKQSPSLFFTQQCFSFFHLLSHSLSLSFFIVFFIYFEGNQKKN